MKEKWLTPFIFLEDAIQYCSLNMWELEFFYASNAKGFYNQRHFELQNVSNEIPNSFILFQMLRGH